MEDFDFFGKVNQGLDFYKILGCDRSSTTEQITTEYRIRALKLHPDKNSNKDSQNEFKILKEAKETLVDPKLREKYDFWLDGGFGMSWNEWRRFTEKSTPVFHWINKKQEPMIMSSNENNNDFTCNSEELSNFRFNSKQDDSILLKFRNYQI